MASTAAAPYYTTVSREALEALQFDEPTKENSCYVARVRPALTVSTPPVRLATSLDPVDVPFLLVRPEKRFARFLAEVEALVLATCLERAADWFPRKKVDPDNFKSFFKPDGDFKVRVPADVLCFDEQGTPGAPEELEEGCHARCVLTLERICFGKREFGAMWAATQVKRASSAACAVAAVVEERGEEAGGDEEAGGGEPAGDELEFE